MKKISLDAQWRKDKNTTDMISEKVSEVLNEALKKLNISHVEVECESTGEDGLLGIRFHFTDKNAKVEKAPAKPKKYDHYSHLKDKKHGSDSA